MAAMYRVIWEIDLEAESAVAAAEQALGIQRSPESIATVFRVAEFGEDGIVYDDDAEDVDLVNPEPEPRPDLSRFRFAVDLPAGMDPAERDQLLDDLYEAIADHLGEAGLDTFDVTGPPA